MRRLAVSSAIAWSARATAKPCGNISNDDRIYWMTEDAELEVLLSLDGASYEAAPGYAVEFTVRRTQRTEARPHGISYALVFRPKDGEPYVRFDNAHAVETRREIREGARGSRPLAPDGEGRRTAIQIHDRNAAAR
jgi:hypothetical protein